MRSTAEEKPRERQSLDSATRAIPRPMEGWKRMIAGLRGESEIYDLHLPSLRNGIFKTKKWIRWHENKKEDYEILYDIAKSKNKRKKIRKPAVCLD